MASFANHIVLFFFLLLSSSVQIQARESKFFSKIFHLGAKISPLVVPTPTPAPAPASAPALAPTVAPATAPANIGIQDPYYGLYGHGSGMVPPAKEGVTTSNTPTAFENELFAEELADEKYESGYEKNNYNYNNNNNGYTTSKYNNNGYTLSSYNNNGYSGNYNTNGYNDNYNNNGYETERQGMSDTRFVEGGKYYYNMKNEQYYPNGYEFSSSKGTTKNEGYYGNTENSNEFNSMEEFQNKEDQYMERQEEYVP
ncbi:hypothetical protein ES319_A03G167700v1 [Gossypium barbadense]|uniref:Protein E6-like n=1 Tax=Gossypium barbadense TaxID=3634 RepID=A0A2P5XTV7_GOSBA|nr:hypothetical protein ES319_A03G167700v1 [Gossypium barbadense]PPS06791.1 hypothetical protein GOBAR_AA13854 [Gossypium barbadense]